MAIHFYTSQPREVLDRLRSLIDEGKIKTWSYDKDGDFTHTAQQWRYKAWLRPQVLSGELALFILPPKEQGISTEIYAIYHGRFVETALAHVDRLFASARASAMPELGDSVS